MGGQYIFKHLSFDIHLKFGLWPLSFKFILFTYLDSFRGTIEATPFRGANLTLKYPCWIDHKVEMGYREGLSPMLLFR